MHLITIVFPHKEFLVRGGVGIYLHDTVYNHVIDKSCNHNYTNNIVSILIALSQFNVAICCMYCPSQTKLTNTINTISALRERLNGRSRFVVTGDFNINILNDTNFSTDFLNELHALSLYPTIKLLQESLVGSIIQQH